MMIFIFAAIGSAAGLGNLWRFPYLSYQYGGGAFLLPYFIALIVTGIPLLALEFSIGQYFQKAAVGALRGVKKYFGVIGWWMLGCSFLILSYYAVVMAWSLIYFLSSFNLSWASGTEGFFNNTVLQLSSGIGSLGGFNIPVLISLGIVWILIYLSVSKGIDSVSKVVAITMPLPILLLVVLLVRAVTLAGSGSGLALYLTPVLSALWDPEVWLAAFSQIFFTLTLGFGVMIAYASYMDRDSDITKSSLIISVSNAVISILSGFVVFATLGFMASKQGVPVKEVVASGPGLAFVVFPKALSMMPFPWLFALLFFIVLLTLGIDSGFSLIEGINAAFYDSLPNISKEVLALTVSAVAFLAGIIYTTKAGLYFLDIIDHFITNFGLILMGLFEAVIIGWFFGAEKMRGFINDISNWDFPKAWSWSIKFVTPVILVVLLATQLWKEIKEPYGGYPAWALAIGWVSVFLPFVLGLVLNKWYGFASDEQSEPGISRSET